MSGAPELITIDAKVELADIEKRLGSLKAKAPKVLSMALNDTAKWAGRELATAAQERYRIQKLKFAKEFHVSKASTSRLEAAISAKGEALSSSKFKISPTKPQVSASGAAAAKLAILKEHSAKNVTSTDGMKAFIAQFQSGHVAVVQREPSGPRGGKYTSSGWASRRGRWSGYQRRTGRLDDTRIQEFFGPSVPAMLHKVGVNEEFIEAQEPKILEHLQEAITKRINTELYFASKG